MVSAFAGFRRRGIPTPEYARGIGFWAIPSLSALSYTPNYLPNSPPTWAQFPQETSASRSVVSAEPNKKDTASGGPAFCCHPSATCTEGAFEGFRFVVSRTI